MPDILIYTATNCQYSKRAKKFLRRNQVNFVEKDVSKNGDFLEEMIEKTGKALVPIIDIGDDILIGFDEQVKRDLREKLSLKRKKLKS